MIKRDKGFRKHKAHHKWVRRVKYWGMQEKGSLAELLEKPQFKIYKTTGSPCSCPICSYNKYDRKVFKKETKFLLKNIA